MLETTEARESFSLLEEPWIPCRLVDGSSVELSLTDVLSRPEQIRGIESELPAMDFALLRLLLAVMYGALGQSTASTGDWYNVWNGTWPGRKISDYLQHFAHRFDLLHPREPFFQVADLHTAKDELGPVTKIMLDVPDGHIYQSMRAGGGLEFLSFSEAARWVVTVQAYDVSGIKSGAVGDPRVKGGKGYPLGTGWTGRLTGTFVEGSDLRQTLLLNFVGSEASDQGWQGDAPIWARAAQDEKEDPQAKPLGPASLYTWQSRRVRLGHDGRRVHGVVLAYGDRAPMHNMHGLEPLGRWRRSSPQEKKLGIPLVYMPRGAESARRLWRGVAAVLPLSKGTGPEPEALPSLGAKWLAALKSDGLLPLDQGVLIRAVGLAYGPQDSTVADQVADALLMHLVTVASEDPQLHADLQRATEASDRAVRHLRNLAADVARAENRSEEAARERISERAYAVLQSRFEPWLAELTPESSHSASAAWIRLVEGLALDLGAEWIASASPAAWAGRGESSAHVSAPRAEAIFRAKVFKDRPTLTAHAPRGEK